MPPRFRVLLNTAMAVVVLVLAFQPAFVLIPKVSAEPSATPIVGEAAPEVVPVDASTNDLSDTETHNSNCAGAVSAAGFCLILEPISTPVHMPVCGADNDGVENAADLPEGVDPEFILERSGSAVTVTYAPLQGFEFQPGSIVSFEFQEDITPCESGKSVSSSITLQGNEMSPMAAPTLQVSVSATKFTNLDPSKDSIEVAVVLYKNGNTVELTSEVKDLTIDGRYFVPSEISELVETISFYYEVPLDEAFVQDCSDGELELVATFMLSVNGGTPLQYNSPWVYRDCSFGDIVIDPVLTSPSITEICDDNNDKVIPAETQPEGVNPVPAVSQWSNNQLTLTYSTIEGYAFAKNFNPTIVVSDRGLCTLLEINGDYIVATIVCGFGNDEVDYVRPNVTAGPGFWTGPDFTLTLTAHDGYTFSSGKTTIIEYHDTNTPCVITPSEDYIVVVEENCGPANDVVTYQQDFVEASLQHWDVDTIAFELSATDNHVFSNDQTTATILYTDQNTPCPVTPDVSLVGQVAVCGSNNDVITFEQEGVSATIGDWDGNSATVLFAAADGWVLSDDAVTSFEVTDEGECNVVADLSGEPVAVCGADNDEFDVATQPEGVRITDTGWHGGKRTVVAFPLEGYALVPGSVVEKTFVDAGTPCEVDPETAQMTFNFKTSDGGSIEGTEFFVYAQIASQASAPPYAEGVIGQDNTAMLEGFLPGEYRLVASPDSYEPIGQMFTVFPQQSTQEITIEVKAIQAPATQTPVPTPTAAPEPTEEIPADPTQAASNADQVTGLPQTGAGPNSNSLMLGMGGLLSTAIVVFAIGKRKLR